ncbi:alpha/beta hydrolase [Acidicapsa ligni]|uniref:alpha/beta hydrolase n=1 Tax=Acidicapsa ligni TaxID=542300 RepID=UPI0021DF51AB|nr:alpha/beta hydrolase [Acidicapsa ligni]
MLKLLSSVAFAVALAVVALSTVYAGAQASAASVPCTETNSSNAYLGITTVRLWPGDAPEAKGVGCEDIPTLSVLRPQPGKGNGSAVLVFPGGAYMGLASILEGREVADWFTAHGFTAFVLRYRLGKKYLLPVPLIDARRAVQLVRARALDYHISPDRIVVIGFSAGGHLAGLSGTQFVPGKPDADDPIERVSSRPNALVLGYPWIGGISPNTAHLTYCKLVDVMDRCEELQKAYSPNLYVTKDTPPTFIYHTTDDKTVPVEQALSFYTALLQAGVSGEIHIFAHGAHGSGLGAGDASLDQWPSLLENWLRAQGFLAPDQR